MHSKEVGAIGSSKILRYVANDARPTRVAFEATCSSTVREALFDLGFSRAAVGRMLADGQLVHNGRPAQASAAVEVADGIEVLLSSSAFEASLQAGCLRPPEVLYEDPFMLAVNKPAALLVHPDGTGAPSLTNAVDAHLRSTGASQPSQAVQRLDVDTTGVVLFSKTREFQCLFDALVAGDGMTKRYLAVVSGAFRDSSRVYSDPLGRDRHDARRMRVVRSGGQEALTAVERLAVAADGSCSLLAVTLGTGRRHQIRVHLSAHGYPLVGDTLYGYRGPHIDGLMLHAYQESFDHPVTGCPVCIGAGWPQRFLRWFDPKAAAAADRL